MGFSWRWYYLCGGQECFTAEPSWHDQHLQHFTGSLPQLSVLKDFCNEKVIFWAKVLGRWWECDASWYQMILNCVAGTSVLPPDHLFENILIWKNHKSNDKLPPPSLKRGKLSRSHLLKMSQQVKSTTLWPAKLQIIGVLWPGQAQDLSTPIHRLLQSTLLSRHSPSYTLPSAILLFMPGQLNLNWTMLSSGCQKWKGSSTSQDLSCVFWMVPS